jgi:hypothetical protein
VQGPENRDELQRELDNTISVRFIPIFGANTKNIEGLPWHEAFMICFNSDIISILNYTSAYLASQVSARGIPKKDISILPWKFLFSITLKHSTGLSC